MVRKRKHFSFTELLHTFWPIFLFAALIPVLTFGVTSTGPSSLFSRADSPNSMRVWIEPSTVVTTPNQQITLTLMAELDKPKSLLPSLSATIVSNNPELRVETQTVSQLSPFGGRIAVGKISLFPTQIGTFTISIPNEMIDTGAVTVDTIQTGGVTVIVQ